MPTETDVMSEQKPFDQLTQDELANMTDEQLSAIVGDGNTIVEPAQIEMDSETQAEIEALAKEQGETISEAAPGHATEEKKEEGETVTTSAEKPAEEGKTEERPDGILAKDGKHVIPYWRLEEAERRTKELQVQIETLQAQVGNDGQRAEGQTDVELLSDEELTELEADLPAIGKVLRTYQSQIKGLQSTVADLNSERQQRVDEEMAELDKDIDAAIMANEKLKFLYQNKEHGFKLATAIDDEIIESGEFKGKPFSERFNRVVELYEDRFGEIRIPQAAQTQKTDESEKVAEALAKAAASGIPTSISALPAGSIPAADEASGMSSMTGPDLQERFMKMTPEQIEAELSRVS